MSKGFEWCIERASDPALSGLSDRDWSKAVEVNSERFFDCIEEKFISDIGVRRDDGVLHVVRDAFGIDGKKWTVHLRFDPDADFSYFTSECSVNDGTILFANELFDRNAFKVITMSTYDKVLETALRIGRDVYWTIGNFVCLLETGERFAPTDKPWVKTRMTVLLPLRMDVR